MLKRPNVFGKTRPAEGAAGSQVVRRDVELGVGDEDPVDIGGADAQLCAHSADFIREDRLDGVKCVVDELRELALAVLDVEDRSLDTGIDLVQRRARFTRFRPDDNLRWFEEVLDR